MKLIDYLSLITFTGSIAFVGYILYSMNQTNLTLTLIGVLTNE